MSPDRQLLKHCIAANIKVRFSRSSGAGGQNVNKVNTKVSASLNPADLSLLTPAQRTLVTESLQTRLTKAGRLLVQVQDERTQARNLELAVERLTDLVTGALRVRKKRKKTAVPPAVKHKRREVKKMLTERKKRRRFIPEGD